MDPQPQSDDMINDLVTKSNFFAPNVVLYFERNSFLDFKKLKKADSKTKTKDFHPYFDMFDPFPMRTSRIGSRFNNWTFNVLDFMLDIGKGWFMPIRDVEKEEGLKWFIYMRGQFYFYDERSGNLRCSSSSGVIATKGKTLTIRDDLMRIKHYDVMIRDDFQEFEDYLDGCFRYKSAHPLDSFVTSFRAFRTHPIVCDRIASFYRYFMTNPTFLLIMSIEQTKTPTQKNIVDVWLKAADTNIVSIARVWFYGYFKMYRYESTFTKADLFFFLTMRHFFEKDISFKQFKEDFRKDGSVSSLLDYKFTGMNQFMLSIVYNTAKNNGYEQEQAIGALMKFIFFVLLDKKVDINECLTEEMKKYAVQFETEDETTEMISGPLINIDDIKAMIKEISDNVDTYVVAYKSSSAATKIENYNLFLHPRKVRVRPPSDASFRLEANPAIRRRRAPPVELQNIPTPKVEKEAPKVEKENPKPQSKKSVSFILAPAPNYTGDEEPPMESDEISEPTVQVSE